MNNSNKIALLLIMVLAIAVRLYGIWWSLPDEDRLLSYSADESTMKEMIKDMNFGANFVVLMIVKLSVDNKLEGTVTVYRNGNGSYPAELVLSIDDLKNV